MVDLSKLKLGDIITYRNGHIEEVEQLYVDKSDLKYPYQVNRMWHNLYGNNNTGLPFADIMEIIPKATVDIPKINLGDTVIYRSGHSTKVFQLAYHEDLNVFEVNVQMYQPNGKVNKDYEHRVDIVQVIKGE